jgi:hypothetical protein
LKLQKDYLSVKQTLPIGNTKALIGDTSALIGITNAPIYLFTSIINLITNSLPSFPAGSLSTFHPSLLHIAMGLALTPQASGK